MSVCQLIYSPQASSQTFHQESEGTSKGQFSLFIKNYLIYEFISNFIWHISEGIAITILIIILEILFIYLINGHYLNDFNNDI